MTSKEVKLVIKKLYTKKNPDLYSFTGEFYKTFKGEFIPILTNSCEGFSQERGEKTFHIILGSQYYPDTKTRKLQTITPYELRCKILNPQPNPVTYNKNYTLKQGGIYPRDARLV